MSPEHIFDIVLLCDKAPSINRSEEKRFMRRCNPDLGQNRSAGQSSFDYSPGPVQYGALAYPLIDEGCETCHLWLPLRSRAREPSCSDPSPFFTYRQLLICFSTTFPN